MATYHLSIPCSLDFWKLGNQYPNVVSESLHGWLLIMWLYQPISVHIPGKYYARACSDCVREHAVTTTPTDIQRFLNTHAGSDAITRPKQGSSVAGPYVVLHTDGVILTRKADLVCRVPDPCWADPSFP
jgi:hypothetical protein